MNLMRFFAISCLNLCFLDRFRRVIGQKWLILSNVLLLFLLPVLPVGDVLKLAGVAPAADGAVVGVEAE